MGCEESRKGVSLGKAEQLGMSYGKAANILRKSLLYGMARATGNLVCFRCGNYIDSVDELSIDHKVPWLHSNSPKDLFFDLDNIAFSHHACNVRAARRTKREHPSSRHYALGCRCSKCCALEKDRKRKMKARGINIRGKSTYKRKRRG